MNKAIRHFSVFLSILVLSLCMVPAVFAEDTAEPTARTLFSDDFAENNGAKWNVKTANGTSTIAFSDGMVTVNGSGPENRLSAKPQISANNFTVDADLWLHEGNTNCAIKFVVKADAAFTNRYQITYDGVNRLLCLEKVTGGAANRLAQAPLDLAVNTGADPHQLQIDVQGDTVTAHINGEQILSAQASGLGTAPAGYFAVASQFPNQQYSVDNVSITTTEPVQYAVTLKTMTNGVIDTQEATVGGTLTADVLTGTDGDTITLTPSAKEDYELVGYSSLLTDTGNSTDGLLTITNNQFTLSDKTGNVTIIAQFRTIPKDPNLLFSDNFSGSLNGKGQYSVVRFPNSAQIEQGALVLSADEGVNYLIAATANWTLSEENGESYRIALDASKYNTTAGTVQIAFRGGEFSNRYVLALNGSLALIRRFDSAGGNQELASIAYTLNATPRRIVITVVGDTVSVTSDDVPVISYRNTTSAKDTAGWSGVPAGLGLINMTAGAPVVYDNVTVTKFSVKMPVKVTVTNNGAPDGQFVSGVAFAQPTAAAPGQEVTLTALPKAGYRLEGYYLSDTKLDADSFLMPESAGESGVTIRANFVLDTLRSPAVFYVDSQNGSDSNSGVSETAPWKTLQKVAAQQLVPGDNILLKTDSRFDGEAALLTLNGSGTASAPITVSSYGNGRMPCLNGLGQLENVVSLYNQEYIVLDGLEITNLHPDFSKSFALNSNNNTSTTLRAVNVSAKDFGVVHGIQLKNLYIHDVNGNLSSKWNGGIFFDIKADVINGALTGIPTKYDGILIENCKIEKVDRSAIKLVNSAWANQSLANNPNVPLYWYPSTNIVVKGNVIGYIGGDGITVRDADGSLIEYNLVTDCRYQNTGYNAGIWPFQATNTVIQYNEVARTRGTQDGQGLDCDHISAYTVMQYNYSHDNYGGFMLIMNGFPHIAPTIRYNISQNDKDKSFEFSRGTPAGTMIYNNTIYSNSVLTGRGGVFDLANSAAGTGNREVYVFNNLFYYPAGQAFYCGEVNNIKSKIQLYNNAYFGGIAVPAEERKAITAGPMLTAVGTAPTANNGTTPFAGRYLTNQLDGYRPLAGSSLINQGILPNQLLAYYNGTAADHSTLSPTELFALSSKGKSIDFTAAGYLPLMDDVTYEQDMLGNWLPTGNGKTTIGAVQYDGGQS